MSVLLRSAPSLLPCLTFSEQLIVWFIGGSLQRYFLEAQLDPYLISAIKLVVHITVNSYIGVPLMFSQFGEWVHMARSAKPMSPYGDLDRGLPNRASRIAVVSAYIALNLLSGFIRSNSES
jgi:hypothetical protein